MAIRDWHENDRPREKLLKFGAASLSDAELLAIFLRVGVKGKSAVQLAQDLLDDFGCLHTLLNADQPQFCQAKGLGQAKYVQLQAVLEMAHRHFQSGLSKGSVMDQPQTVANFLSLQIGKTSREHFGIMLLDQQNRLIEFVDLFVGTLNQASVHTREVIQTVLDYQAAAVVLAHNHPSGDATPSRADIDITQTIAEALDLIEVRCLDHIIIGDKGRWSSLKEQHLM